MLSATATALTILVLSFLVAQRQAEVPVQAGRAELRYGRSLRRLAVVLLTCSMGFLIAAVLSPRDAWWIAMPMAGILLTGTGAVALEFFTVRLVIDAQGMVCHSPWRRSRTVTWADLTGVRFSNAAQWFTVDAGHLGRIRLHTWLDGLHTFRKTLVERRPDLPSMVILPSEVG